MKLSNIIIGKQLDSIVPMNTYLPCPTTNSTVTYEYPNLTDVKAAAYKITGTNTIPVDGSYTVNDCTYLANQNLQAVYIGKQSIPITLAQKKDTVASYTYVNSPITLYQAGCPGMMFNQYVNGNNTFWGFECVFKCTNLIANRYLIQYGHSSSKSNPATNQSNYKIYINNSDNSIVLEYQWYGSASSGTKWYTTTISSSIISIAQNKWYHFCALRIADGNAYHGSGSKAYTPVFLEEVTSPTALTDNDYFLPKIQYNSGWKYNGAALNTSDNNFFTNLDFVGVGLTTKSGNMGRQTGGSGSGAEYTTQIDFQQLGDSYIQFGGKLLLRGGAYTQQSMNYIIPNAYVVNSNPKYNTSLATANGTTFANSSKFSATPTQYSSNVYKWVYSNTV